MTLTSDRDFADRPDVAGLVMTPQYSGGSSPMANGGL